MQVTSAADHCFVIFPKQLGMSACTTKHYRYLVLARTDESDTHLDLLVRLIAVFGIWYVVIYILPHDIF